MLLHYLVKCTVSLSVINYTFELIFELVCVVNVKCSLLNVDSFKGL